MKTYKGNTPELCIGRKKSDAPKVKLTSAAQGYEFFKQIWDEDTLCYSESFMCIFLNRNMTTIGWMKVSSGGLDSCIVDVRMILGAALKCGASAIMMAHNHPSGNLTPSTADDKITNKCKLACDIMDIALVDHMIVTDEGFYSYANEGKL